MTNNTQTINSVIALAGVKGSHLLTAAVQGINSAAYHAIVDGNTRPFDETKQAIPKGTTKEGNFANNQQGLVLSALISAAITSREYFVALHTNGNKLDKKLTAEDKALAQQYANSISEQFLSSYNLGAASLKASKAEASAKTQATKAAKAESEATTNAIKEQQARIASEAAAADSLTVSDFLKAIKGGNVEALQTAELISNALNAYKLNQANKAAQVKSKQAAANASPVKLAA